MVTQLPKLRVYRNIRELRSLYPFIRSFTTHPPRPALPTTPTCPPSECSCAAMPQGLDIDYNRNLSGTMPAYAIHVVIRTGRRDWSSRIEDDPHTLEEHIGGGNFARSLKDLLGRGGKYHNPDHPVLISNISTIRSAKVDLTPYPKNDFHVAHVYPNNIKCDKIPNTLEGHEAFLQHFVLADAHSANKSKLLSKGERPQREIMSKINSHSGMVDLKTQPRLYLSPIAKPSIFICGHNNRDSRCGTLGPVLAYEFTKYIDSEMHEYATLPVFSSNPLRHVMRTSDVALISHVGGHAFAGNVVVYFPRHSELRDNSVHPLAGKGVWYGRVEPKHVWGIMKETVEKGVIIEDLLRGVR